MPVVAGGQRDRGQGRGGAQPLAQRPNMDRIVAVWRQNGAGARRLALAACVCPTTPDGQPGAPVQTLYTAARITGGR